VKFLCGQCQARYQIADERVRGKVLTVRCKQCQASIIVRETAIAVGAGSVELSAGVAPDTSSDWYVAIDGAQQGPLSFAALARAIATRKVGARHHVWREGMGAWSRVENVPLLKGAIPAPPPPPLVAVVLEQDAPVKKKANREPASGEPTIVPGREATVRAESTRVFIRAAGVAMPAHKNKAGLVIAGAAVLIGMALGGLLAGRDPEAPAPAPRAVAPIVEEELPLPSAAAKLDLEGKKPTKTRKKADAGLQAIVIVVPADDKPEASLPPLKIGPRITNPDDSVNGEAVQQILDDNASAASDCASREKNGVPPGKLVMTITIAPDGTVTKVGVESAAYRGLPIARCISDRMKRWRFPPFKGDAVTVLAPFTFS